MAIQDTGASQDLDAAGLGAQGIRPVMAEKEGHEGRTISARLAGFGGRTRHAVFVEAAANTVDRRQCCFSAGADGGVPMSKVSLVVGVETLRISSRGAITANIWLEIGEHEFPVGNWNDFVVVIIGWWAIALQKLLKGSSDQELIDFMDGPYAVEIRRSSPDRFLVRGLKGTNRNVEVVAGEIDVMPFIDEFIGCAQKLLDNCEDRNFRTSDVETLQISLHALCREYFGRRGSEYIF